MNSYRIHLCQSAYFDICAQSPVEALQKFRIIYPGKFTVSGISQLTDERIQPLYIKTADGRVLRSGG